MSYVFITRMFSGLFETIRGREWKPSGIPTFIKLVEMITQKEKVIWFVVCRTMVESSVVGHEFRNIVFKDRINMFVIPYKNVINSGKVNAFFTTLSTLYYIVITLKGLNGRLFYFDRSNIVIAAIFKVISSSPVVIRLLGLYPDQKELSTNKLSKLISFITFISYKVKYDLCVCTQDGSGVEYYVGKLLNMNTKRVVLLNGVVKNKGTGGDVCNARIDKKVNFLFVGSLTQTKGIPELINAFALVNKKCGKSRRYQLLIVGKGEFYSKISSEIKGKGLIYL
jgi:glycosyltransferase involved in cell wall biosynthesis